MPIDGNFAAALTPAVRQGVQALGMAPLVQQQAQLQAGLQASQAAKNTVEAQTGRYKLNQFQNPNTLNDLDRIAPGLGVLFSTGGDVNNIAGGGQKLQQLGYRGQVLQNLGDPGTDPSRINMGTSVVEGKTYEPFKAVGDTGNVIDQGTGQMRAGDAGMRAIFGEKAAADIEAKRAAAGNAGQKWDPTRGVMVDANTGTARPVTMAGGGALPPPNNPAARPLPPAAVKMQQEALESVGLAGSMNADLASIQKQIDDGTLHLGLFRNKLNEAQNYAGNSDEESRAYSSFKSTLEKMRNDSLRLNKGVQTEGDAERAWNELLQNINDPKLVSQRLGELQKINQRAAELKGLANDQMRANFGRDPMDYSAYSNQKPAVGTGSAAQPGADGNFAHLWGG